MHYKLIPQEQLAIQSLLDDCISINLPDTVKQQAIRLKQHRIKLPDAIIAASAQVFNLTLLTADKGFRSIPELDIALREIG